MARDLTRVTEEEEERLGKAGGSTVWPPKWGGLTSTHPAGTPQVEPWARTTLHPTPPPTPRLVATPCSRRNAMLPCKDAHGIWMPRSQKGEGGRRAGRWSQHKPGQRRGGGPISGRGSGFWFQLPPLDLVFSRENINHLRYADDTTLTAESEEELKSLLMKVNLFIY